MRRFLGDRSITTTSNGNGASAGSDSGSPMSTGGPSLSDSGSGSGVAAQAKRALASFGQQLASSVSSKSPSAGSGSGSLPLPSPSADAPPPTPPRKGSPYISIGDSSSSHDEWDSIVQLPFSSSPASPSTTIPTATMGNGMHSLVAAQAHASSLVDLKDEMMMELLSSDALLHIGQFEILGWDEVEELRKEHSLLSNRLTMLTHKLAVETKIRDATISISRLYTSKRLSRQADDQVDTASGKVEATSAELNRIARREADVRTRVLRHTAAVLGLMLRRVESSQFTRTQAQAASTPLPGGSDRDLLSPKSPFSPAFSTSTSTSASARAGTAVLKFDGPHLFAGHKDATLLRSPPVSPQMPAGMFSGSSSLSHSHSSAGRVDLARANSSTSTALPYTSHANTEAEARIAELSAQLADAKTQQEQAAARAEQAERELASMRADAQREAQSRANEERSALEALRSALPRSPARAGGEVRDLPDFVRVHLPAMLDGHAQSMREMEDRLAAATSGSSAAVAEHQRRLEEAISERSVLSKKITRLEADAAARAEELARATSLAETQAEEAERQVQEAQAFFSSRLQAAEHKLQESEAGSRSLKARLENLQADLQSIRADKVAMGDSLKGIWARLPPDAALRARLALSEADRADKWAATFSSHQQEEGEGRQSFSLERFALRLGNLITGQEKLADRFAALSGQLESERAAAQDASEQLRELEVKAGQSEASLLTRVNELQSSLDAAERARERCERAAAQSAESERQLADVREELAAAQDELDEVKSKESRQRIQMLDELTTLTEEASSLRTQLRTAQRKLANAGLAGKS